MIPNGDEIYVIYMIMGDGHDYSIELATEEFIRDMPYSLPSESYFLLPGQQS